ncbi:MAG: alpha/beta hydrolase [Frankiales bacterium]|nr:alpha/beta hydrolase [Frankiales bacterium]
MALSHTAHELDQLVTGSGEPVTVVAHGLGASIAETRPLLTGVAGTKVFYAARGHGASPLPPGPFDYDVLGRDLEAVAGDATAAVGVSMGAGALLSLLARRPDRFARAVIALPAALDRPRTDGAVCRLLALADALDAGDAEQVHRLVLQEVPAELRSAPGVAAYASSRTVALLASPGVAVALRALPQAVPVVDASVLGAVTAQVLVLAQEGDPLHPAQVARDLVALLPRARLVVFDRPGMLLRERARLRELVPAALAQA